MSFREIAAKAISSLYRVQSLEERTQPSQDLKTDL